MATFSDFLKDNGLSALAPNADRILVTEGSEPTSYSNADTLKSGGGVKIAELSVTSGDYNGPQDSTGGREVVPGEGGLVADESGSEDWAVHVDDDNSRILAINPLPGSGMTAGLAYNLSDLAAEVQDA